MANFTLALDRWAARTPDAPALVDRHGTWCYAALNDAVWRLAAALRRAGIGPGTVVGHTFASEAAQALAMLAVARLGATVLCLSCADSPPYRLALAERAGVRMLLADHPDAALPGLPLRQVALPARAAPSGPLPDRAVADPAPRAPAVLIVGSGSTGRKKLMPLSHGAIAARTAILTELLQMTERDRIACCSPLDYATCHERLFEALGIGASFVLLERRFPEVVALCRREAVTILHASVFHAEQLVRQAPPGGPPLLDGLRVLRVGSATVSEALRRRILQCLSPRLYIRLGINEFGSATMAGPEDIRTTPGTVGRPAASVQIRLLRPDGQPAAPGEVGQLWLRGPGQIDGYLDDPQATAAAFRDGWFTSHDLALRRPDGQLVHCGRADHLMIYNGINVSPTEVEDAMSLVPGVQDVACVPLRSEVSQDVPVCVVALEPGASVRLEDLAAYARDRLGPQRPRDWFLLAAIPRTDRGKLVRAALYEQIEAARAARRLSARWTMVVLPRFDLARLDRLLVERRMLPAAALPPAPAVAGAPQDEAATVRALALRVLLLAAAQLRAQGAEPEINGQLRVRPAPGQPVGVWQVHTVWPLPFGLAPVPVRAALKVALTALRPLLPAAVSPG